LEQSSSPLFSFHQQSMRLPVYPHSHQNWELSKFFTFANLMVLKWYLVVYLHLFHYWWVWESLVHSVFPFCVIPVLVLFHFIVLWICKIFLLRYGSLDRFRNYWYLLPLCICLAFSLLHFVREISNLSRIKFVSVICISYGLYLSASSSNSKVTKISPMFIVLLCNFKFIFLI
jgi:hypothetical protein